jgi:hypothetical protein
MTEIKFTPVAPKRTPRRASTYTTRTRGFDLLDMMGRPALYGIGGPRQATSEEWARARSEREAKSQGAAVKIDLPEHQLCGGEHTERGRQLAKNAAELEALRERSEETVEVVEETAEKLQKPSRRRRKR